MLKKHYVYIVENNNKNTVLSGIVSYYRWVSPFRAFDTLVKSACKDLESERIVVRKFKRVK